MTTSKEPKPPVPDAEDRSGLRMRAARRQPTAVEWLSAMTAGLKRRSASLGVELVTSMPELLVAVAGDGAADCFGNGWTVHVASERGELFLVRRDARSSYWFSFELMTLETLASGVTRIKEDLKRLAKSAEPNAYAVALVYTKVRSESLLKTIQARESLELATDLARASIGQSPFSSQVVELSNRDTRCWVQLIAWCATEALELNVSESRISVPAPPA